jgi:hypothetical protein
MPCHDGFHSSTDARPTIITKNRLCIKNTSLSIVFRVGIGTDFCRKPSWRLPFFLMTSQPHGSGQQNYHLLQWIRSSTNL